MTLALSPELQPRKFDRNKYKARFSIVPNEYELRKLIICVLAECGLGNDDDEEYAYEIWAGEDPFISFAASKSGEYLHEEATGKEWSDPRDIYFMGKLAVTEKFIRTPKEGMKKVATVHRDGLIQGIELFFQAIEKELGVENPDSERFAFVAETPKISEEKGILSDIYDRISKVGKAIKRQI